MPAGNNANLIPLDERDPEEARRIRQMGQAAGVKERLRRKSLKEQLLMMLEDDDLQKAISVALMTRAKLEDNVGNRAYEIIRDTIGEKEPEVIKFKDSPADELLKSIDEMKNKQNEN